MNNLLKSSLFLMALASLTQAQNCRAMQKTVQTGAKSSARCLSKREIFANQQKYLKRVVPQKIKKLISEYQLPSSFEQSVFEHNKNSFSVKNKAFDTKIKLNLKTKDSTAISLKDLNLNINREDIAFYSNPKNEKALDFVLAHELGHLKQYIENECYASQFPVDILSILLPVLSKINNEIITKIVLMRFFKWSHNSLYLKYLSRCSEYDADQKAALILNDTSGGIEFFNRKKDTSLEPKTIIDKLVDFIYYNLLATHPSDKERIAELQELQAEIDKTKLEQEIK